MTRGDRLDLTSDPWPDGPDSPSAASAPDLARPFLGIHFLCCDIYSRIYLRRDGSAYQGACPRCAKPVQIRVGPGGTDSRFFTAS